MRQLVEELLMNDTVSAPILPPSPRRRSRTRRRHETVAQETVA
jgi:hypothetical protein